MDQFEMNDIKVESNADEICQARAFKALRLESVTVNTDTWARKVPRKSRVIFNKVLLINNLLLPAT